MVARSVAFATSAALRDGAPDDRPALEGLRALGIEASPAVWDDPSVDWASFDAVVVRSTWDYPPRARAFLGWIERVHRQTSLWNAADLLRWNLDKRYLLELAGRGVPIVPTECVEPGSEFGLVEIAVRRGWEELVVKPVVGADAFGLKLVGAGELPEGEAHLRTLLTSGPVLVQPLLPEARRRGERSLVFLEGRFSHALDYPFVLSGAPREGKAVAPEPRLAREFETLLKGLGSRPLYARADLLPTDDDRWLLGELELIEPELFLRVDASSVGRFVDAIAARLADSS